MDRHRDRRAFPYGYREYLSRRTGIGIFHSVTLYGASAIRLSEGPPALCHFIRTVHNNTSDLHCTRVKVCFWCHLKITRHLHEQLWPAWLEFNSLKCIIFPFRHHDDTVIIVHSVSYPKVVMTIGNNYAANKMAGVSIWPFTSSSDEVQQSCKFTSTPSYAYNILCSV
jgi:hypothetical protein